MPEDPKEQAKKAAAENEKIMDQLLTNQMDTGRLLGKIDHLAHNLRLLGAEWESIDPHRSSQIREQLAQLLAFRKSVEQTEEYDIAEAEEVMATIMAQLKIAKGQ